MRISVEGFYIDSKNTLGKRKVQYNSVAYCGVEHM